MWLRRSRDATLQWIKYYRSFKRKRIFSVSTYEHIVLVYQERIIILDDNYQYTFEAQMLSSINGYQLITSKSVLLLYLHFTFLSSFFFFLYVCMYGHLCVDCTTYVLRNIYMYKKQHTFTLCAYNKIWCVWYTQVYAWRHRLIGTGAQWIMEVSSTRRQEHFTRLSR